MKTPTYFAIKISLKNFLLFFMDGNCSHICFSKKISSIIHRWKFSHYFWCKKEEWYRILLSLHLKTNLWSCLLELCAINENTYLSFFLWNFISKWNVKRTWQGCCLVPPQYTWKYNIWEIFEFLRCISTTNENFCNLSNVF